VRRATEVLRRADGDKKAMSSALMATAAFEAGMGRFEAARASIRRARALLDEVALTVWMAGPLTQLSGWVELLADDPAGAERELRWGFDKLREIGEMSWFSTVAALLGEAVFASGRPDEAEQLAQSSRESSAPDDAYSQVLWRTVASKVHAERGEGDASVRLAREAVDIADGTDFLQLQWHTLLNLAHVLEQTGHADEAASVADRARDVAARKGSPVAERRAVELASRLTQ
jgi:ATP/maltotriose-dependent transcriptional regulator MalT